MWLTLAFTSAALLGFYDVAKKKSLTGNAVLPVLLLNTLFSSLVFLPALLSAECGLGWFEGTVLEASPGTLHAHGLVVLKSVIVLTSWIFGYFGMKHLPITIVGPINATRPVMVLVGAMLVFGERLNACQWAGVLLALVSLFMLSRSSRREGVDFAHNVWILCIALAAVTGGRQRAVRQIHHGAPRPGLRAKLVQPLSILHDGRPDRRGMVAEAARLHAFPLELGHPADLGISVAGRLRLPSWPCAIPTP